MALVRKLWAPRPLEVYHARTRTRGVNSPVYWFIRAFAQPALMLYFRLARNGHRHVPGGGVILASNHRSFLDPFVLGCCVPRPIYFVAKQELFKNPLAGWILNCLGAFPLRRGRIGRGVGEDLADASGAGPGRGDLPRGHPRHARIAQAPAPRGGSPGARERRSGGARRGERQRARPAGLADPAGQGAPALRRAAHLPARGPALALPGRRGDRAHLALRRPPVGVARRPAPAAHRRGGGRGIDGHRRRHGARAGGTRGEPHLSHPRAGRAHLRGARELRPPAGRGAGPAHRGRARCGTWSWPAWTWSCWPCPAGRCPPPWATSAHTWESAAPCSWCPRGSCRHSAPRRPPSSPSGCAHAPWPRWPVPRTPARRSSRVRRWCWPPATRSSGASWARCSRPAGSRWTPPTT